ncbi:uncharacterized protein [Diabrotica undecimpunctata]|uniref:uncharacterized protein isoform X1 n=1 Tax=Diabrotica undecimpunctata TaxID=50387 RepID=UPI003B63A1CF
MNLTSDLIRIQGILSNLIKNTGEFTKVNYRGGNEDVILTVMLEIQSFLKSRNYVTEKNIPNTIYDMQLQDIVLFLALNTSYKHSLNMEEYSHLINITPPLSKCLFANVVYGLDLCKYYCTVIEKLPIKHSVELLDEVSQCLKKSTPDIHLKYANMFLTATANKISSTTYSSEVEDDVSNLCEVTNLILMNLSGMYTNQIKDWKKVKIYNHMGHCLLAFFQLLLRCDENLTLLRQFLENVMRFCTFIIKNVTVDVFISWAETDVDDENLQMLISNKGYLVLERYQKLSESKDLVAVLGSLAKKPKSITEQIHEADIGKMINKINKMDRDQINWFKALIRTQIFENEESAKCVKKWHHLCDKEDVSQLLNWCVQKKTPQSVELTVKCLSTLDLEKLTAVATTYFYKNKFIKLQSSDVAKTLRSLLNKAKEDSDVENDLAKEILILFMQQPVIVLPFLYEECIKNSFYTNVLKKTFEVLKDIIKIDNIGVTTLLAVFDSQPPNEHTINNCIQLFKQLMEIGIFNNDVVLTILGSMLKKHHEEGRLEVVDLVLQMFLGDYLSLPIMEDTKELLKLILTIMNKNRCTFLTFDSLKMEIVRHTVDICCDVFKPGYNYEVDITIADEDHFTRHYRTFLISGKQQKLSDDICGDFKTDQPNSNLYGLLKALPSAVNREWLQLVQETIEVIRIDKCLEVVTDVMILLAQLTETQDVSNQSIYSALRYCLRNYGLVMQQKFLNTTIETESEVNRQVCKLLIILKEPVKEEEGLSLVNLLTERSLKSLVENKDFLCHLILIKNNRLAQVLAQKMTQ